RNSIADNRTGYDYRGAGLSLVGEENVLVSVGINHASSFINGRYSAPSLVSMRGIVFHCWCQWEEYCPIVGVSGRHSAPSLVSVGGIICHHWCQWEA
ncbi:unnamed protein product, partial [Staurois parvus]